MNEEIYNQFGLPLKKFIREKSGSLKKFCKTYGFKTSTMSSIIRGNRKPNPHLLWQIEQLGFSVDGRDIFLEINDLSKNPVTVEDFRFILSSMRSSLLHKDIIIEHLQNRLQATLMDLNEERRLRRIAEKIHEV